MNTPLYLGATELEERSIRQIVALAMDGPRAANSGHSGTAMALAPLGVALFSRVLRHDPVDPQWLDRDRFILSVGHASILQYGLAHTFGYDVTSDDLKAFRQPHSRTPGHPEVGVTPTVEVTTGPLGQGFANGVGMALAQRVLQQQYGRELVNHHTWVVVGDGCLQEGVSHEAASLAGQLELTGLTAIYDDNHITIDGPTELAFRDDTPMRFRSYGWNVVDLDEASNDLDALEKALVESKTSTRPTLLVLRTHIGYPASSMMDRREAHGSPFDEETIRATKELLGVSQEAFAVDLDIREEWLRNLDHRRSQREEWLTVVRAAGEQGVALLEQFETNGAITNSRSTVAFDAAKPVATRKALQKILDTISGGERGLVSGSADLTDNTGVILSGTGPQSAAKPDGQQVYYGIREFGMGAVMVGMALHGGIRPIGSTFFVFSDYVRPAIRLAALSHASVLFVFTHDSVGVGEDGPTHQPIEHLMSLRAMPNLHVVRPSDANETQRLAADLLRDPHMPPTALILSRQDMPVLAGDMAEASQKNAQRGGYVVSEDADAVFTLVASGSEVGLTIEAAQRLRIDHKIATRVVALPCWACFEHQPEAYRREVLRRSIPSVAIEAGSTLGWQRYVDEAIGVDSFGMSAPAAYVFDYFNISASAVVSHVREKLGEL